MDDREVMKILEKHGYRYTGGAIMGGSAMDPVDHLIVALGTPDADVLLSNIKFAKQSNNDQQN